MTGVIPVIPRFKFTDASGNPLSGGSVTVYLAGTTTLANTFQDKALTIANTNPVALDGNGACLFWVDPASNYKLLLKDSHGATVSGWPVDNVSCAGNISDQAAAAAAAAQPYVTAAAGSASASASSAAAALADRLLADASKDVALNWGGVYDTVALGLAAPAVASGSYFGVIAAASTEYLRIYKNNSGVESLVKIIINPAALQNYFGLTDRGATQITPFAISTSDANFAWYEIDTQYLFQDRFGQTPVTAAGQSVGLIVPRNGEVGPGQIPGASSSFTSATGWTVGAGWSINTAGAGKAVATAANAALSYPLGAGVLTALRKYCVDIKVANYSAGTLQVDVGAAFANVPITANGIYRLHILCGATPTAGAILRTVGFTGEVEYVQIGLAPAGTLYAASDAVRGTYQVHATHGPYVDFPAGTGIRTDGLFTMTSTAFACLAIARDTETTFTNATLGAPSGGSMNFQDNTSGLLSVGTSRSGQFTFSGTRTGMWARGTPVVATCSVEPGFTTVYVNKGERSVRGDGTNSGQFRRVANTWLGGDSWASGFFGINYTTGTIVNANTKFYGGMWCIGQIPSLTKQRKLQEYWMAKTQLLSLYDYEYDVFAVAGQSNAMGVGDKTTSTAVTFGQGAEYIDMGYLRHIQDPTQHAPTAQVALSGSMWPAFAQAYYNATGRRACIVGSAFSGEGLINPVIPDGSWLNGERLTDDLGFKYRNCMKDIRGIGRGVLYLGGEQDVSLGYTQLQYENYLIAFRDKLRLKTGDSRLKLLLISLDNKAGSESQYAIIRAAMANVATYAEGIKLVLTFQDYVIGQGLTPDGVHWNQTALNDAGPKVATACAALFLQ
jgi:hypothetical protein